MLIGNVLSVLYDYNFAIITLVFNLYLLHCHGLWTINHFVSIPRTKKGTKKSVEVVYQNQTVYLYDILFADPQILNN